MTAATTGVGTGPKATSQPGLLGFVNSTMGAKVLVALTGIVLVGFLVAHLAGNLLVYGGRDAMNVYAETLKSNPVILWGARGFLLACLGVHVILALKLAALNARARPVACAYEDTIQASWASRHMVLTGLLVLAFLVYHLLHFTVGVVQPQHFGLDDPQGRVDVYVMLVQGFLSPVVSASYLLAMIFVALHVSHGFGSLWRTLGVSDSRVQRGLHKLGVLVAVLLWLGFVSIPLAVLAGFVKLPGGAS